MVLNSEAVWVEPARSNISRSINFFLIQNLQCACNLIVFFLIFDSPIQLKDITTFKNKGRHFKTGNHNTWPNLSNCTSSHFLRSTSICARLTFSALTRVLCSRFKSKKSRFKLDFFLFILWLRFYFIIFENKNSFFFEILKLEIGIFFIDTKQINC